MSADVKVYHNLITMEMENDLWVYHAKIGDLVSKETVCCVGGEVK